MHILIVGAGAVGSLLGHRLAGSGHAVTLVGRPAWAAAVASQGLILEHGGRVQVERNLVAVTDVRQLVGAPDLIVCTTKAYDTGAALRQAAPVMQKAAGAPLLLVQNGVGGEALAAQARPGAPLLSGALTLTVEVTAPGRIRLTTTRGGVGLASVSAAASRDRVAELLRRADFEVKVYRDFRAMKWSKLLLNMLGNALPAILDMPPDRAYAARRLFAVERAAFREALAVMRGLEIDPVALPGYPVPLLAWGMDRLPDAVLHPLFQRFVAGGRGGKPPSLHLDLLRGKRQSEVDFLNGAVVAGAESIGMPVPVNRFLHNTLRAVASGQTAWAAFRGRPRRLLARLDDLPAK
jgi:2-dehydropantoate 2-reductase